jgi:ankyrin repeat protein
MTTLLKAIHQQDVKKVAQLIEQGVDVNELDSGGDAPIVMAAYKGDPDIVLLLLQAGADLTAVDPGMKATALHAASYAGRTEAAKLLIQFGVAIDKQGPFNGYTALHDAIWQGNLQTAKLLIDSGANLSLQSHQGETPLAFAKSKHRENIVTLIQQKMAHD